MKKILNNLVFIIAGIFLAGISAFAVDYLSGTTILYDNKESKAEVNNVQAAIDDLYTKTQSSSESIINEKDTKLLVTNWSNRPVKTTGYSAEDIVNPDYFSLDTNTLSALVYTLNKAGKYAIIYNLSYKGTTEVSEKVYFNNKLIFDFSASTYSTKSLITYIEGKVGDKISIQKSSSEYITRTIQIIEVSDKFKLETESVNTDPIEITFSGGGYVRNTHVPNANVNIDNNNFVRVKATKGTSNITNTLSTGTDTSSVQVSVGGLVEVDPNAVRINAGTQGPAAGDDGWGGNWRSAEATILVYKGSDYDPTKPLKLAYGGGAYTVAGQTTSGVIKVSCNGFSKITSVEEINQVSFILADGTTTTAVALSPGNSLDIPSTAIYVSVGRTSGVAGDDGWGGNWLGAGGTVSLQ